MPKKLLVKLPFTMNLPLDILTSAPAQWCIRCDLKHAPVTTRTSSLHYLAGGKGWGQGLCKALDQNTRTCNRRSFLQVLF